MPARASITARAADCHRETYSPGKTLPELRSVGWSRFLSAKPRGLAQHTHPGGWELCYIVHGQVEWWVEDEVFQVKRGEVYLTRPGERHGGVDAVMNRCELYWLIVSLPRSGRLPGMKPADGRQLVRGYERMKLRHFPGSPGLPGLYERVLAEQRNPWPLSGVSARAALHQLLVDIWRDHDAHLRRLSDRSAARSGAIDGVLAWVEKHLEEPIEIGQMARQSGLSQGHFRATFLRQMGQSPGEYLAQRRLLEAKRMLRANALSVTQIAHRLSFSTSQYFATVFKKLSGLTPLAYRKRHGRQGGPPPPAGAGMMRR